ncbi:hypothetical protein A8H39_02095 [Paraburkholderia fungorum]|uniref:hypothetical protein n=1 Tax=Paraburkholderia fungorum TaxID=134537 RepID=UPI00047FFA7A|nr:hypothetical protein [Paraburkholderia fungorum]PNE59960.1 hypothetical protein A8H39_02095 [Paraburkholderia fungorum]
MNKKKPEAAARLSVVLQVPVSTRARATPAQIAKTVDALINIGLADVVRTLEGEGGDQNIAKLATDLTITATSALDQGNKRLADLDAAQTFWGELQSVVGPLKEAAEHYGHEAIIQLFYLQNAILENGKIDSARAKSPVATILKKLPSGDRWLRYLKRA